MAQVLASAPLEHANRVQKVKAQFETWKKEGGNRRIVTGRPGWQRVSLKHSEYKKTSFKVTLERMSDILEINTAERYVKVEPLVNMGQLVPAIMKKGWTLPVVPELEELTVGGMIAGTGVESSSHHSGLFQEFCIELELVLASGECVTCSRTQQPELFEAFFWSYGTLGFLMSAKLRIIQCEPYVRLVYYPFDKESEFIDFWTKESQKGVRFAEAGGNDVNLSKDNEPGETHCARFIEGLVFSENDGVVMLGEFASKVGNDGTYYNHGAWHQPYFYRHASDAANKARKSGKPVVEYLPIRSYYYRHSRSVFWEMENIVPLGDSPIFRWGFGWMLPPSVGFLKITTPPDVQKFYDTKHVVQDMLVPATKLAPSLATFRKHFDIYPLWVCPMVLRPNRGLVHPTGDKYELFVDIGAYGVPGEVNKGKDYDVVKEIRAVEEYVTSVKGYEMLYADSYMTRNEFGKMFDRQLYDSLRKQLGADKAFPDIYDKIVEPKRLAQLKELFGEEATK
eukprot:CAMPEP_0206587892 /NCGR_PEP_ID=MMETSP0325_2-20121206/37934_1 /ASSEMBLY_ACC=CAM_ASM_000347 /TAXON_ID=2866 /ORGANISM="Crypthecodinium cohnii, Strain Seligo" /LENGTH=507 /DNA_ID=CAMNT_0054096019 /DNA_START=757 /DNA_END=2280 /DNA_ORIENTATION=-